MNEILLAIIVVLILLVILVSLFWLTIKRVNILVKKIFVDKLQEYDFLIEDKEKKVEELNSNIESKKLEENEISDRIEKLKNSQIVVDKPSDDVIIPTNADYEDGNLLESYKKIKSGFNFDYKKIIENFIENEVVNDNGDYELYNKVRNYFSHNIVYKLSNYSKEEQMIIINELLNDEEKNKLKKLLEVKKFNVIKFVNKLDDLVKKNNPKVYIYVSDQNLNFNNMHKQIETIYDDKIVEGFRIEYKGKIYDYSI